jgi:hypothetical protein
MAPVKIQISRDEGVPPLHLAKAHLDAARWSGRRGAWRGSFPRLMSAIGVLAQPVCRILTQPGHSTAWTYVENCLRSCREHGGGLAMKRREFMALISVSAAWPAVAQAQQRPTLGLLSSSEMADWAIKPFRAGLEEGGFVEGRNLTVIYRSAEDQFDRLPALAEELAKSQVSVISRPDRRSRRAQRRQPRRRYRLSLHTAAIQSAMALLQASTGLEGMSPAQPSSERHSRQSGWACCGRSCLKSQMLRCL